MRVSCLASSSGSMSSNLSFFVVLGRIGAGGARGTVFVVLMGASPPRCLKCENSQRVYTLGRAEKNTYSTLNENEKLLGCREGDDFFVGSELLHTAKDVHVFLLQYVVIGDHGPECVQDPAQHLSQHETNS